MGFLIALAAIIALAVAAYLWGADTRDGRDWQAAPPVDGPRRAPAGSRGGAGRL